MNVVTKYFKTVDLNAENFKEIEKVEKTGDFNVIFVDGSMEVLWKNVYLFKVAYLIFKNWNVIKRGVKLKKEEVSEKKSSHVMRFFEMDVARELAEENPECAIVIDGSLSGMRRRDYEWMREKKIIGLSKETSISIDNLPVPIYLHGSALKKGMRKPWIFYPFIAEKNENVYFWDTMIANFNRKVPAFRIDFLNLNEIDAFKILFYYALN
ncbi:MAG: hypothetical protein QXP04_04815, partial [Candidatus Nanoarchaeia archaeon]|nr:hypothetical protein [Candidatus Jingweiarchaeum tengchongense]